MEEKRNFGSPFRVFCKNCGHPAEFSIEKQSYACPACGETSGIAEVKRNILQWRHLQRERTEQGTAPEAMYNCIACGAQVIFPEGEATQTCEFCGSRLVRQDFETNKDFPELILPFQLTEADARKAVEDWISHNKGKEEAKLASQHLDELHGWYLPYEIVRGPVKGETQRNVGARGYPLKAFVDGALVNTSVQFDNDVLDGMEPFDTEKIRPFEYGYIAGHRVKLADTSDRETEKRMLYEAGEEIRPALEKVFSYPDVNIRLKKGDLSAIPLLLPVYLVKTKDVFVCVNGDTGRVAAALTHGKESKRWMLEPLLITLVVAALVWFLTGGDEKFTIMGAIVVGAISFTWASDRSTGREIRPIRQSPLPANLPPRHLLTPLFYLEEGDKEVPVRYTFYTPGRCMSMVLECVIAVLLPALLAILINGGIEGVDILYGAAWYCLVIPCLFIYFLVVGRELVFDFPDIYELLPDGGKKLLKRGKRLFLPGAIRAARGLGGAGYALIIFFLFLFFGSMAAMLP